MELIRTRQQLKENNEDFYIINDLTRKIRYATREDNQKLVMDKLALGTSSRTFWQTIRQIKKGYTPRHYAIKYLHGEWVPLDQQADWIATQLPNKFWTAPSITHNWETFPK